MLHRGNTSRAHLGVAWWGRVHATSAVGVDCGTRARDPRTLARCVENSCPTAVLMDAVTLASGAGSDAAG